MDVRPVSLERISYNDDADLVIVGGNTALSDDDSSTYVEFFSGGGGQAHVKVMFPEGQDWTCTRLGFWVRYTTTEEVPFSVILNYWDGDGFVFTPGYLGIDVFLPAGTDATFQYEITAQDYDDNGTSLDLVLEDLATRPIMDMWNGDVNAVIQEFALVLDPVAPGIAGGWAVGVVE